MALLLVFAAPGQILLLAGLEHGRTIPYRTSNASLCEKTNLGASKGDCLAAKATDGANGQYNVAPQLDLEE